MGTGNLPQSSDQILSAIATVNTVGPPPWLPSPLFCVVFITVLQSRPIVSMVGTGMDLPKVRRDAGSKNPNPSLSGSQFFPASSSLMYTRRPEYRRKRVVSLVGKRCHGHTTVWGQNVLCGLGTKARVGTFTQTPAIRCLLGNLSTELDFSESRLHSLFERSLQVARSEFLAIINGLWYMGQQNL